SAILEDAGEQTINLSGIADGDADVTQSITVTAASSNTILIPNPTVTYTSDNSTGSLAYTPVSNKSGTAVITVTVTDNGGTANSGGDTKTMTFTVTVTAVNDTPTDIGLTSTSVDDDSESGTIVGALSTTDPDIGDSHTYSIVGGNDESKFTISGSNLKITETFDYHVQQSYQVTIRTTDSASATYDETFTIVASNPNNRKPVVTASQSFTIAENQSAGTDVGTVQGSDADNETLQSWTIESGTNKDHYTINSSSGLMEAAKKLDYEDSTERTYSLGIKVSDGNEFSDVVTVAVSVTAVNDETPAVTSNQSFSLDENSSSGESLGTLQATDADVWPSGTSTTFQSWTITSGNDDDDFALESSTGELTTATSLDYETTSAYSLKVTVSDGDNTSSATTVTISVNNVNDKPTITSNPSVTTDEDVEYVFSTSNWNYSDVDNDALSKVKITGLESKGWLYLDANDNDTYDSDEDVTDEHEITTSNISNGHLRFAPVANGNGSAYTTFTFQVRDGTVYNGSDRTMTINVTAVNDKPTTSAQTVSVNEDTDVAITLAGADVDGDNLTYAITTLPSNGTLYQTSDSSTRGDAISSTGTTVSDESHQVIYRSAEHGNGNGHGNFAFKVNDGTVDSDVAAVTVNVAAVNDVPVAAAQTVTVNEDTDVTITLSGTDVEESTLTYKISTLPANGTLYQTADGSTRGDAISEVSTTVTSTEFKVIYVPAENGNGDGHGNFGFKVNDGTVDSDEATVTVNVTAVSDPPVAADEALVIAEDTEITYTLKWVDPDSDESSSLKKTTGSRNSGKKSSRSITRNRITPKNSVVNNLKEDNSSEQTNITKPTAPTTGASFHSINGIVLKIQALPIYGTLKQADNTTISSVPTDVTSDEGKVIYKPKENYVGLDTFKYNAVDADNLVSGLGVISINITGVNDPPIVESIDDIINEDESKTYTLTGSDQEGSDISFKITGLPKQGAITKEDGTIITSVPASLNSNQITYTPDTNFFGRDTVEFQANDGSNNSDDGLITILVNSINDPPVAVRDTINLDEDGTITFSVSGSDIESTDLTYSIQMLQSIGTLYQTSDGETKGTEIKTGDLITNTDQKMIFQGQENGYGVDSLIFKVSDGTDYDSATVVIDIASVPDPPVAQDGDLVIAQALVWDYDVSSKVSDPDGDIDASSLAIVSSIGGGDYRVPVDATLLFVMDYSDNKTYAGIDTVVYQVCDLTELCDTGTIIITVTQGRQPLAISDTLNISEDALPTLINVLSNDSDIDGDMDASTLKLINDPVGEFQGISNFAEALLNGEIKFSVALNYNGKDSLKYKISDETRLSGEASLYIFVDPSPDPPEVVSPLTVTIEEDEIMEIELYAYDADGDTLTYTLCQEPQNCTIKFPSEDDILSTGDVLAVSATESPTITVTPQLNFTGSDVFTYCVEDEDGNTVIAQVLITVVDIPDPPVALADTISIYQGDIGSINVLSNDTDPENDMDVASLLIYGKDTFPSKSISTYRGGLATVSDSSVMLDYTSFFMFFGSDTLDYSICDIFNTCDTASIYINVVQDDIPPAIFNITTDKDTLVLEEGGIASRGNALATDLTISATVKDSLPLESVLLNVGKGGSEQYTQHQIPFDAGVRMLEIERTVTLETIDEKGIKFYFFASDILGYASNSEVHSLPVKIPPGVISFPECIPSNTWILISIPTQLDDNTIEDVFYNSFGQIDEDKFVVWQYVNGEYVHPTEIVAGLSYWVYQKIGEECDFTIGGGVVTNVDTLKWVLKPGWNLVGNPYPFPFDLGNVDQTLFCGPLEYNEQGGWSGCKTNITPFGGYIICNKADTTVVLTATGGGGGQVSTIFSGGGSKDKTENNGNTAMKRPEKLFRTQISFSTIKYSDNSNFIGIHSQAENDFDRYDNVTEPPVPNNDDKIKFDWVMDKESDRPKYLLQDIRNAGDSTFTWHGYLHPSNSKEKMTVKINLEGDTDPGYKMVMVDKSHGDQYDLIQKNSFILKLINTSNLGRQFTVFYGPASWVEEEVSELIKTIPTEYHLSQNYPNPFNPVTTINYQIPTDQKVRLSIYNILGQEVKTLINGEQYAGFYTIRWDGTSNSSIKVSSGTYLYIIQTANYRQVKKMVLLK
ncbi:MAG TPA: tandem-95 repeat protein, partial [Flavobacteriales bacterium]|nr:tandem-95 repeat protein [Flavobacteriales bacterium]